MSQMKIKKVVNMSKGTRLKKNGDRNGKGYRAMRDDEYRRHTELEGGRRALRQDSHVGHTRIRNEYMMRDSQ
ncbi:hypothetical protein BVX98_05325 [bacterium F11]|nr:hypothetical protein BVX98_05325 [bacterium F11]